jgi:hypothetical protein
VTEFILQVSLLKKLIHHPFIGAKAMESIENKSWSSALSDSINNKDIFNYIQHLYFLSEMKEN